MQIHRSPSLQKTATTIKDGIRVTTTPRTLADLKGTVEPWEHRRAIRQAEYLGLPTALKTDRTRSDLEAAFLRLCRRHGIPPPEVNIKIAGFTVDFLWREQRLVVETDGYAAHRGRQAFLDDRARELTLAANGLRLRRFSDEQVDHQADEVAAAIRSELAA
jgi:very-short-patch-repair endonuclease